jgi:hypothetical protein
MEKNFRDPEFRRMCHARSSATKRARTERAYWATVVIPDEPDECWGWTATRREHRAIHSTHRAKCRGQAHRAVPKLMGTGEAGGEQRVLEG